MNTQKSLNLETHQFVEDFTLWREIKNNKINQKIFFDTSSVIHMLRGINSLNNGYEGINKKQYNSLSMIVYSLTYNNWLGKIHLLSPHLEEFFGKIKDDTLFSNKIKNDFIVLKNELINQLDLHINNFEQLNKETTKETIEKIEADSLDMFRLVFLFANNGFWKSRYKYLVKETKILNFDFNSNYRLSKITETDLFKSIFNYLDSKRGRSFNSYVDALSLCLLDKELQAFEEDKVNNPLPLFFSDQEEIIRAVRCIGREFKDKKRQPFTVEIGGKSFCIIRDAKFFIIDGIFKASQKEHQLYEIDKLIVKYEELSEEVGKVSIPQDEQLNDERNIKNFSEKKILLEFFNNWWIEKGYYDLISQIEELEILKQNENKLSKEVEDYIRRERENLDIKFEYFSKRIELIKKSWIAMKSFPGLVNEYFSEEKSMPNMYKEFGPRFVFEDKVCETIQNTTDHIFEVARRKKQIDNELANEIISNFVSGIYDEWGAEEEKKLNIEKFTSSLGVFWVFKKYELIDLACSLINQKWESLYPGANEDKYPHPSIALVHAAAIYLGKARNEEKVNEIFKCVRSKFDINYRVWIGLSYLSYLIWLKRYDVIKIPEQFDSEEKWQEARQSKAYSFLHEGIIHLQNAINYLKKKIANGDKNDFYRQEQRERNYYYALNNFIFFNTIASEKANFKKLKEYVDTLASAEYKNYFHEGRFHDTLARYYFRLALLQKEENNLAFFEEYLTRAYKYNKTSFKNLNGDSSLFELLRQQIMDVAIENNIEFENERSSNTHSIPLNIPG